MTSGKRRLLLLLGLLLESTTALATSCNPTSSRLLLLQGGRSNRALHPPIRTNVVVDSLQRKQCTAKTIARTHRSAQSVTSSALLKFGSTSSSSSAAMAATAKNLLSNRIPFHKAFQKTLWASLRGGGGSVASAVSSLKQVTKTILDDVAASKTKSWAVLLLAIMLETCASTLSKRARDAGRPLLFVTAVSLNMLRCERPVFGGGTSSNSCRYQYACLTNL